MKEQRDGSSTDDERQLLVILTHTGPELHDNDDHNLHATKPKVEG